MPWQIAGDQFYDPPIGIHNINVGAVVDRVFPVAELADFIEDVKILGRRSDLRGTAGKADQPQMKRSHILRQHRGRVALASAIVLSAVGQASGQEV
jgi:hypothetical protein